ncbi:MAG TPA: hypothetical protein VFN02_12895 [Ktedonobacteraceae bacterium]|nr:hypothetical protein [Ktedonobacteraceae bacterium]
METRFYASEKLDIERLANDLENIYGLQGYQVQQLGNKEQKLIQLRKGSDVEALVGLQSAVTVTMQRRVGGVLVMIGQEKWIDKAAAGVVGLVVPMLWPLTITAGFGVLRQIGLSSQVMNMVDGLVCQQQPDVQTGPAPTR